MKQQKSVQLVIYSLVILSILSMLSMVACQKRAGSNIGGTQPGTQPNSPANTPASQPNYNQPNFTDRNASLSLLSIAQDAPNSYVVQIDWQAELDSNRAWVIQRFNDREGASLLASLVPGQKQFIDAHVIAGEKYRYAIGNMENARFTEKLAQTAVIPLDLVVNNEQTLSEIKRYNRVFLTKDAVIRTNGGEFNLTTNELHSEGGAIRSYTDNDTAPVGHDGKTAEPISIRAKKAFGTLKIFALGIGGGNGVQGPMGATGAQGAKGAVWGLEGIHTSPSDPMTYYSVQLRAEKVPFTDERWRMVFRCTNPGGSNGGIGGPGYPGAPGYRGGRGGNSPKVFLQIEEPTQLEVQLTSSPGRGGAGGAGGEGGQGGPGGPGDWDPHHICPEPQTGVQGPQGPKGPVGLVGEEGQVSPFCMIRNGKSEGNCETFPK